MMKYVVLVISYLVCLLWPCYADAPIMADISERQAAWYGAGHIFYEIKVFPSGNQAELAAAKINHGDSRNDVADYYIELLNLPLGWQKIESPGLDNTPLLVLDRGQTSAPLPKAGQSDLWFLRHPWLSLFFVLLGFYAVFAIGLSGGPNHGEHPFILNVCHLVGFLFLAKAWQSDYYYTYLIMLVLALAISIYVTRIRIWEQPMQSRLFKGLMIGCYVAMFLILNLKTYTSYAAWSSPAAIQFYVSKQDRGPVQVLGEKDQVLAEFSLTKGIDCRAVLFWNEKEQPRAIRIASPHGGHLTLELRKPGQNPDKLAPK